MHQSSSVTGCMPVGSTVQWNVVMRCQHTIYLIDTSMLSLLIAFHTSFNIIVAYLLIVILEITHLASIAIKWRGFPLPLTTSLDPSPVCSINHAGTRSHSSSTLPHGGPVYSCYGLQLDLSR